ncbi:MAG: response regulator [Bryobacteraceae bacterium]
MATKEITTGYVAQIILAEDNPADVVLVRMALQEAGLDCELHVMADGEKTISFIEELDARPTALFLDLLLLDMHLPKRDGEAVLRRLRSTENFAQTPVIVMTASDAPRDHAQAEKHAALHYFRKPSNLDGYMQLGVIIRDLLFPKAAAAVQGPLA